MTNIISDSNRYLTLKAQSKFICDLNSQGLRYIELEIELAVNEFKFCPICLRLRKELYPKKIAMVADCLHIVCKACLRNYFRFLKSKFKFCPVCNNLVNFESDKRTLTQIFYDNGEDEVIVETEEKINNSTDEIFDISILFK